MALTVGDPVCDRMNGYFLTMSVATRVNSSLVGYRLKVSMLPATDEKKDLFVSLVILPAVKATSTSERKFFGSGKGSGSGFSVPLLQDTFFGIVKLPTELELGEVEGSSLSSSKLSTLCSETRLRLGVITDRSSSLSSLSGSEAREEVGVIC